MTAPPFQLDRAGVRRAFDRASADYDGAAALQTRVREELIDRLRMMKLDPAVVLDLGAGTGQGALALKRLYGRAAVIALDIAPGMLREARRHSRLFRRFGRVCGDARLLPLKDASVDLVFSSLLLQWCDDLDAALAEYPPRPQAGRIPELEHARAGHLARAACGVVRSRLGESRPSLSRHA